MSKHNHNPVACPACGRSHFRMRGNDLEFLFSHACDYLNIEIKGETRDAVIDAWNRLANGITQAHRARPKVEIFTDDGDGERKLTLIGSIDDISWPPLSATCATQSCTSPSAIGSQRLTFEEWAAPRNLNSQSYDAAKMGWVACLAHADTAGANDSDSVRYCEALELIEDWARAYPLTVFPEPDWFKVAEALRAAGITLDAVSASNMRHVITGVQEIVRAALHPERDTPEVSHE